jgi:hypothetical protein
MQIAHLSNRACVKADAIEGKYVQASVGMMCEPNSHPKEIEHQYQASIICRWLRSNPLNIDDSFE